MPLFVDFAPVRIPCERAGAFFILANINNNGLCFVHPSSRLAHDTGWGIYDYDNR